MRNSLEEMTKYKKMFVKLILLAKTILLYRVSRG